MEQLYEVRHTFRAKVPGEDRPVFFTRDTEHRVGELTASQIKRYGELGYIVKKGLTPAQARELQEQKTAQDPAEQDADDATRSQQANIDAAEARGARPPRSAAAGKGGK